MMKSIGLFLNFRCLPLCLALACGACNDDKYAGAGDVRRTDSLEGGLYVCCEGLFNGNNSTIARYSLSEGRLTKDYFGQRNGRGLGETANALELYGGKLYCVVTGSNLVDVIDARSGVSLRQVRLLGEGMAGRQPRRVAFHGGKAYVCSFDGTLARIDTLSLEVEAVMGVGRNPDGVCVANGMVYVSNSGGLDYPNYDNTVSVVDPATFSEVGRIEVAPNPNAMHADSEGDVYVASQGDFSVASYRLQRIRGNRVVQVFDDLRVSDFVIHRDTAYLYGYDFASRDYWIKVLDCRSETIIRESFITDGTRLVTPFGIGVNPVNGDVYLTDALDFSKQGNVYCFGNEGRLKFKVSQVGLNPNRVVYVR